MRNLNAQVRAIVCAFWLVLELGCVAGGPASDSTDTSEPADVPETTETQAPTAPLEDAPSNGSRITAERQYLGTAATTVTYFDAFGKFLRKETYREELTVSIVAPRQAGGIVESNPFSFSIGSTVRMDAEGQIQITSAVPFTDPRDGVQFLFQYWKLTFRDGDLSGALTDTHAAEAMVLNFLNAAKEIVPGRPEMGMMAFQYGISKDATLQGTLDSNEIRLRIQGNVTDESRPFTSEIVATRVK